MSSIHCQTLAASALALFLGLGWQAAAQPSRLEEARHQMALGCYRGAEDAARRALGQPPGETMQTDVRQEWLLLLAEVYYHSRQYGQALEQLHVARQLLDDQRRLYPKRAFTTSRLKIARWQALIELAQAAAGAAPPSGFVGDDIPAEGLLLPEQVDRLELLVLRAQLVDLREGNAAPPDRKRRWAPLRQLAKTLSGQTRAPGKMAETQASVLISLARCWEGEGNPEQAVRILQEVAVPPPGAAVNPRVEDLRAEAARILHRAKLFKEEASFWHEVLAAPTLPTGEPNSALAEIERLNVAAGIHFERAETLHLAGAAADTVKQALGASEKCCLNALNLNPAWALKRNRELSANLPQKAELCAVLTVSLQGLLRIRLTPQEWNKRLAYSLDENDFLRAHELYSLLRAMRIENDPLVHHLEATLGAEYLRVADARNAKEPLAKAYEFFKAYPLAPPAMRVQLLVRLAETDRLEGCAACYNAAENKLKEADGCYVRAGLKDENLRQWIEVHRGRLAATRGRFSEAKVRYDQVVRWAKAAGNEAADVGSMAQLGLAMLYKGFGKLTWAEAECHAVIERMELRTPAALDEQALVPYHVALAGILILEGKLSPAQAEVNAAQRLSENTVGRKTPLGCELRHLAAMLDFLRCKSEPHKVLAATDIAKDAEKSWLELLALYKDNGDRPGEARTCLYLSQLCFLRWQQQALRNASDHETYKLNLKDYGRRLKDLNAAESNYNRDVENQRASFPDLQERWNDLHKKHEDLERLEQNLHRLQDKLLAGYDLLLSESVPARASHGAIGSSSADATSGQRKEREPKELTSADEWVGRAAQILKDSSLFNLKYLTLCHRAAVLHARAAWNREPKLDDEARARLEEAVALLELPGASLSEGGVARAEFLSQYSQAFDQLIEWHYQHHNRLRALAYAELCRNRTLLDSLRAGGDDGRQGRVPARRSPDQAGLGEVLTVENVESMLNERIRRKDLVIYYHVGWPNSYLFVLGLDAGVQAIVLGTPSQHVSATRITKSVDQYLRLIANKGKFCGASESERHRLTGITDQLLPPEIRRQLAGVMEHRGAPLIVSPTGSLQQMPFEALLVQDGNRQKFLIDCLPRSGIAYTPSLMILNGLEQAKLSPHAVPFLVTVACSAAPGYDRQPEAIHESEAVAGSFDKAQVLTLMDEEATKDRFCREIRERKPACVHVATHSDDSGLTEALVFYPDVDAAGENAASLLTIGEICTLPLADCRLAVLSACRTNMGGEISREMPMSISRAFLVAKARRVVASQWPVDDKASCELMRCFLGEVASRWKAGQSCNYAAAMYAARQKLRSVHRSDWRDDPYYWAPFILIGPACDMSSDNCWIRWRMRVNFV